MLDDKAMKKAARTAFQEELTKDGVSWTGGDTPADLAAKINTYYNS